MITSAINTVQNILTYENAKRTVFGVTGTALAVVSSLQMKEAVIYGAQIVKSCVIPVFQNIDVQSIIESSVNIVGSENSVRIITSCMPHSTVSLSIFLLASVGMGVSTYCFSKAFPRGYFSKKPPVENIQEAQKVIPEKKVENAEEEK